MKVILLLDSDIVFDPQIVEKLLHSDKNDILALNRHELGAEEIKVIVDDAQKVVEISKVCSISDAIGESIGIEKMSAEYTKALFRELDIMITTEGLDNIFYERAFERLIPQGYSFYVMDTTEFFSASCTFAKGRGYSSSFSAHTASYGFGNHSLALASLY